jgi:hypothetical protein
MLRSVFVRVLALVVCLGFVTALFAADGVVVSTEKGTVTVKVGDKEYKVTAKEAKIHDADGKELKGKAIAENLKKDTKVDVTIKDDKVTDIKVKK